MKSPAKAPTVGTYHDGSYMHIGNQIHVANPSDKGYCRHRYLFSFGAIGTTFVLAYGDCLSDALEEAAELLADNEWWGHITPHDAPREDLGCDCADPFECDSHTYTESGWLTSFEWYVQEDPSNADLRHAHDPNGHRATTTT